jgi:hypothetical protein
MSFNKKYLTSVDIILQQLEKDIEDVYNKYHTADALIGPTNSVDLINEFLQAYYENPKQDFSKIISKYKQ